MLTKYLKNNNYLNFLVFLLLFLSGSFLTSNDVISPNITKLLWLLLGVLAIIKLKAADISKFLLPFVLCLSIVVSTLVNKGNVSVAVFTAIQIFIASIILCSFGFKAVINSYSKIMTFLCGFSLIMTLLFFLFPGLNAVFRVSNINNTAYFSNFVIFVRNTNESGIGRNCGMFWEPGAFQTFICFAFIFEAVKKKPSVLKIALFSITMISTFSTTGYFCLAILLLFLLFRKYENGKQIKSFLFSFAVIGLLVLLLNRDMFFSTDNYTVFGKLILYRDSVAYQSRVSSVSIRINAVLKPIAVFINNPLFGVGDVVFRELLYEETLGVTSCTLVNWFAIYGILPAGIVVYEIFKTINKLCDKFWCVIVLFIVIFITTMSENYISNATITMLFMGATFEYKPNFSRKERFSNRFCKIQC